MISENAELVWKVLSGIPMDATDEETGFKWESAVWELVIPRFDGDFKGSRLIGSANLVTACSLLQLKISSDITKIDSFEEFNKALQELAEYRLIRKRPEKVRETFKVIRGNNGSSSKS